jgi:hypothetical protein
LPSLIVFTLAVLPAFRWGAALPIGDNWDAAEFYVPLGRTLQLASQRDLPELPRNPLVTIFSIPPVSGRIHAFSYLHAAVSSATGIEPLRSYVPMMGFVLALQPLAAYALFRVVAMGRGAALPATFLLTLAWLPLWVTYNSFSNTVIALPLLPIALAASIVAIRDGGRAALATGALFTAALATAYYPAMSAYVLLLAPAAIYLILRRRTTDDGRRTTDGGRPTDDGRRRTEDNGGRRTEDDDWRATEDEGQRTEDDDWKAMEDNRRSTDNDQRATTHDDQRPMGGHSPALQIPSPAHLGRMQYAPTSPGASSKIQNPKSKIRIARLLLLAALSLALSPAAQVFFFLRDGFLDEVLASGAGYQIYSFIRLPDALGLQATFHNEPLAGDARLVWPAVAVALLFGLAAVLGRRVPLLVALALGAAAYQGYTFATDYFYGFYKGMTFAIPLVVALIAAGAETLWEKGRRGEGEAGSKSAIPFAYLLVSLSPRLLVLVGMAFIVGLNAQTVSCLQERYTSVGPQLWSVGDTDIAQIRAEVAPGAAALIVPTGARPPTFNSLISYTLLGHPLYGNFATGYNASQGTPRSAIPDVALLPEGADPTAHGYELDQVRWAGAGMRLYGRAPDVRYHRSFGGGGRYPAVAPGETLTLRLGVGRISLPDDRTPEQTPGAARLSIAAASFGPTTFALSGVDIHTQGDLTGGLAEIVSEPLNLPAEIQLRNTGTEPIYLWWGELRDPEGSGGVLARDEAFVQALPQPTGGSAVAADIRLRTQTLPTGPQKLTALFTISHAPAGRRSWQEIGQWVFFPNGSGTLRLDADLQQLTASLSLNGAPTDFFGSAQGGGDGRYQASLLLANNAEIVYGAKLWAWELRDGQVEQLVADAVTFEVVPLPRPASLLDAAIENGALRLRGFTLPRRSARPGETITPYLVWQSLRKIDGDLQARVTLRTADGRVLAEQTAALGKPDHGTSRWQEGELANQPFDLALPPDSPLGRATLQVEIIGPDGQVQPFASAGAALPIVEIEIVR